MLYYQTIDSKTLALLKKLQNTPELKNLRLVGGTALALQIGHRKSIDIDLFGKLEIDNIELSEALNKIGNISLINKTKNINIFLIDGIKVDIVNYPYEWLDSAVLEDDLILASTKDIAAMKFAAITGRGTKKDFIDLYYLLEQFTIEEIMEFYKQKYNDASIFLLLKSLLYFDDADNDIQAKMLKKQNWEAIKNKIRNEVKLIIPNAKDNER